MSQQQPITPSTTTPRELPPGLDSVLSVGYNARKGQFAGKNIFALTYTQNTKIYYADGAGTRTAYDAPDQIRFVPQSKQSSLILDRLLRTEEEFKQAFSIKTDVEGSGVAVSAKAHFEMKTTDDLFKASESKYHFAYFFQTVSEYWLNDKPLATNFQQRLAALNPADPSSFTRFFDDFGTHYLTHGYLGGYMTMITQVKDSLLRSTSTQEIIAGLTLGYDGMVRSGKMSVEVARSSSTFMQQHQREMSVQVVTLGGLRTGEDLTQWFPTCFVHPLPILVSNDEANINVTMLPITTLVSDTTLRQAMEQALSRYAPAPATPARSIFGGTETWEAGTVKHADTDGFLIGHLSAGGNGRRGYIFGKTDANDDPQTLRAATSVHYTTDDDKYMQVGSFFMPVRKEEYAAGTFAATYGEPGKNFRFVPLRTSAGQSFLGHWETKPIDTAFQATTDGFLACTLKVDEPNRGDVYLMDTTDSQPKLLAATSAHRHERHDVWHEFASFCVPVRNGRTVKVKSNPTWGTISVNAYWVPLSQLAFGAAHTRTLNQTFTAETDGFFVAVLSAAEANASRANLMVRVGPPGSASLTNDQTLGMAAVHRYENHDKWLRHNSVTVPIAKGCVYQAVLENIYSNIECTMYWVPLA